MGIKIDRREIEDRIINNKLQIKKLDSKYLKAYCPKSPTGETSYEDYDCIHGSKKEYRIEEYYRQKKRLMAMVELDEQILQSANCLVEDKKYLELLENKEQKVKYLRIIRGYTQEKTADILGISDRHVRRIEKRLI